MKSGTVEARQTASAHRELVLLGLLLAIDVVELFSNSAVKSAWFISSVSWDAFSQNLRLFRCLRPAWEMQQMLMGLENEGRGVESVRCGCAKCPVGLCRSPAPLCSHWPPWQRAPHGQIDVVVVVRPLHLQGYRCLAAGAAYIFLTGVGSVGLGCCQRRGNTELCIFPSVKCCCCFWPCSGDGTGIGATLPLFALCLPHSHGSSAVLLCREIVVLVQLLKYEAITAYFCSRSKFFLE